MDLQKVMDGAEPFFFLGGRTGFLLIHGFTGTPREMRLLGQHLNSQGHTVLGVRLAGHATRPEDMIRSRWQDWLISLEDGWNLLRENCDRIFVIGLSMGGILALLFASEYPVSGAVVIASPHHLSDPRLPYIKMISMFWRYQPKGPSYYYDPEAGIGHLSYPNNPVRSIAELRDLLALMRSRLPEILAPTLLIYSRNDPSVKAEDRHAENIINDLGSPIKQLVWVENSGHIITCDFARGDAFQAIDRFIDQTIQGEA